MKFTKRKKHSIFNKGQSLFELMVAIAMVSLVLVTIISLTTTAVSNATLAREKTIASRYTQETVEWLRNQRDLNWDQFISRGTAAGKIWCMPSLNWSNPNPCSSTTYIPQTRFIRDVTVIANPLTNPYTVSVEVSTHWIGKGGEHKSSIITTFTNWKAN